MTAEIFKSLLQITATEDLSSTAARFKAVTINGTIAQNTKSAAGILRYVANSGSTASVVNKGVTKAFVGSGGVSTVGWPLKVALSGYLTPCASGDQVFGRYLPSYQSTPPAVVINSGDLILIQLDREKLTVWNG